MKKFKIVPIKAHDLINFHDFLNNAARKGWVLKKFGLFYLTFEYQKDNELFYSTVPTNNYKLFFSEKELNSERELEELAHDMEYTLAFKNNFFNVYTSKSPIPFFSDAEVDQSAYKEYITPSIRRNLMFILFMVLHLSINLNLSRLHTILSNYSMFILVLTFLIGMFFVIDLITDIRFYFGRTKFKSLRYSTIDTDFSTILIILFLISYVIFFIASVGRFGYQWNVLVPLIMLPISVYVSYKFFHNYYKFKDWSKNKKYVAFWVSAFLMSYLIFILSNYIFTPMTIFEPRDNQGLLTTQYDSLNNLNQPDCYTFSEESFVASRVLVTCENYSIEVVESKMEVTNNYVKKLFFDYYDIDVESIENDREVKVGTNYVYMNSNAVIMSSDPIDDALIDEVQ